MRRCQNKAWCEFDLKTVMSYSPSPADTPAAILEWRYLPVPDNLNSVSAVMECGKDQVKYLDSCYQVSLFFKKRFHSMITSRRVFVVVVLSR